MIKDGRMKTQVFIGGQAIIQAGVLENQTAGLAHLAALVEDIIPCDDRFAIFTSHRSPNAVPYSGLSLSFSI